MKIMDYINIDKVSNGYIVQGQTDASMTSATKDRYVFETFESLTKWLKENFEKKPGTI